MGLILTLAITSLTAYALRKPLQQYPLLFYGIALLVVAGGLYLVFVPHPNALLRSCSSFIQRGQIAVALFAVVMYVGVLADTSPLRRALMPVRAELSILASIFVCGHFIPYLKNYLGMIANLMTLKANVLASLGLALILLIILAFLTITSFSVVKRVMTAERWKRVQLLAYPFFGLIYFHLLGYFLAPALQGVFQALLTLVVYTALFAAYFILRLRRVLGKR
jgi:DMSO/TMAO reductase YedYZ heme-binding membrane subunit